jgi:ribosomal protein S16
MGWRITVSGLMPCLCFHAELTFPRFFRVTVKTSLNCVASHAHRDGRQIERTYDASVTPDQTLMSWASSEIETALNPGADITNKAPATPGMQLM